MRSGRPVVPARVAGLALALMLLAVALVTLLPGGGDPEVRLAAAGPAPTGDAPTTAAGGQAPPPTDSTTTTEDRLRVEAVHGRTSPGEPLASPADAPVVRPPADDPSGSSSSPVLVPPPTTVAPAPGAAPAPCASSEVEVTVATDRAVYGSGQTVQGSSTLENRSATACLLPTRAFFRILNGAGKDVGSFAYTLEYRMPVRSEPGKAFTSAFTWDQKDCAGSACARVPPGTYTVVADWTESGPYSGRTSFQVTS